MKLTLLFVLLFSFTASANDSRSLISQTYQIEDMIRDHQNRIDRRARLANDLADILQTAKNQMAMRLQRGGGHGGNGRVDTRLVDIALSSCGNINTWNGRRTCFSNYLSEARRGVLASLNNACTAVGSDSEASKCYAAGLKSIQSGERNQLTIAETSCGKLGTWQARRNCYGAALSMGRTALADTISRACEAVGSDSEASKCFSLGINANSSNLAGTVRAACRTLGTWDARVKCFRAGIEAADANGTPILRYVRGCMNISSDSQAAQCFDRSLSNL